MIQSAHDCSEGGAAVALLECCCAGGIGARLEVETGLAPLSWLFSESQSRFVVAMREDDLEAMKTLAEARNVVLNVLGRTGGDRLTINDWIDLEVGEMKTAREEALERILNG
jgi:phosphoribosylformylglycinamidine (FGAM) synthase-like enzyme